LPAHFDIGIRNTVRAIRLFVVNSITYEADTFPAVNANRTVGFPNRTFQNVRNGFNDCSENARNRKLNCIEMSIEMNDAGLAVVLQLNTSMRTKGLVMVLAGSIILSAQPPPRRPPPQQDVDARIIEIRTRLERSFPTSSEQKELASFVKRYLEEAVRAIELGRRFQAERFADAADACRRPIDHLEHILEHIERSKRGPGPPQPPPDSQDQMRRVYFRLRLGDVFLKQIPPPAPTRLQELARAFYEAAVKAQQEGRINATEEYAKSADDLTHALEGLAQAAAL
jgi:hypothetical protein